MSDLIEWALQHVPGFADFWFRAGPDAPAIVIGSLALVSLTAFTLIYYRLSRRLLGYRKFGGAWLDRREYRETMQVLHEDQERGRVLSHEEKVALRDFQHGGKMKPMFFERRFGGYGD